MGKKRARGASDFEHYYQTLYLERWPALRQALTGETPAAGWTFSGETGPVYYLDPASIAVACALPLGTTNLDMCAAPGGKTLILARRMADAAAGENRTEPVLVANELSRDRRGRLRKVLRDHLPEDVQALVQVTGHDASRWGLFQPGRYDAILADVPCSSERHVINSSSALHQWSASRVRRLARRQFAILAAAIDSLRPGGHVLYSTCALTQDENDGVVEKALKRRADTVELVPLHPQDLTVAGHPLPGAGAERTARGLVIMPDRCEGAGPLYCALLKRR